jgi:SAM-dependent methyltransferase
MSTDQSVILFNKNWQLYKKVIDANYMHHALFHRLIGEALRQKGKRCPLRFLDLGCGDASQLIDHLQELDVDTYVGYDLSNTALALAKENLTFMAGKTRFVDGRMEELLAEDENMYDIIHTSFAVHHLDDNMKAAMIRMASEKLSPGGLFIYVDVFRKDGMDRDEYINRYCDHMDMHWPLLSVDEKQSIRNHVTQFDFPSTVGLILTHARSSGLENMAIHTNDETHCFLCFKKGNAII